MQGSLAKKFNPSPTLIRLHRASDSIELLSVSIRCDPVRSPLMVILRCRRIDTLQILTIDEPPGGGTGGECDYDCGAHPTQCNDVCLCADHFEARHVIRTVRAGLEIGSPFSLAFSIASSPLVIAGFALYGLGALLWLGVLARIEVSRLRIWIQSSCPTTSNS